MVRTPGTKRAAGMVTLRSRGPLSYRAASRDSSSASPAVHETGPAEPPKPRLLDRVREAIRARAYSHPPPPPRCRRGNPPPPLQPPHRRGLRRVDAPLHLLSRQAASRGDGRAEDHAVPHVAGGRRQGRRLDPEPGAERLA